MPARSTVTRFPANVQRFIQVYVGCRDKEKAALRSGFEAEAGDKLLSKKPIRAEIERKIRIIDLETAKLTAQANKLQVELIDSELVKTIKISAKTGGTTKVKAMELGYERLGILRDGAFVVIQEKENAAPSIYRALHTTTVRQITEVTEQRELQAPALPAPKKPDIEILDY
jgi:hypothetical protein